MAVKTGSKGGGRNAGHGEGVSPRPMPKRKSDDISGSGGGHTRQFDQNTDPPMRGHRSSIDKSGTVVVSGNVPKTRPAGSNPDHEKAG